MNKPVISLIVAMSNNRCIGINNSLPWHLPEDLQHFKKTTSGKPIIMGRKTFESIGKPLPNRTNIVVTRNEAVTTSGVELASSLDMALEKAIACLAVHDANEVIVIGGAQLYEQALDRVECMYITRVHADINGDAFFPFFDEALWLLVSEEHFCADARNKYSYSFEKWVLKRL